MNRRRHAAVAFLAAISMAAVAAQGCKRTYGQQECRMQKEVVLASVHSAPSAVAAVPVGPNLVKAAWSADGETWITWLDETGAAVGPLQRIERSYPAFPEVGESEPRIFWPAGDRDSIEAESIAVTDLGRGRSALAMLERSREGRPGGAYVSLFSARSRSGRAEDRAILRIGSAGENAARIAIAPLGDMIVVAWHDGVVGSSFINIALFETVSFRKTKETRMIGNNSVLSPALAAVGKGAMLAWTENASTGGRASTLVKVAPIGQDLKIGAATTVRACRFSDPAPSLAVVGDHVGIAFRDDADDDDTPEYYFAMLDSKGALAEKPARISRSDGVQGPILARLGSVVAGATIRSFQRNMLVGLNRFDIKGVKLGGEFQIYADKTDFNRVAIAAIGQSVLLVYAEERSNASRVIAGFVGCKFRSDSRSSEPG